MDTDGGHQSTPCMRLDCGDALDSTFPGIIFLPSPMVQLEFRPAARSSIALKVQLECSSVAPSSTGLKARQ
uniref:Uncharacterized protein n=1 Tax=Triticum urartu TaxID=4572 RepID=A0A8R7UG38_TRIUA